MVMVSWIVIDDGLINRSVPVAPALALPYRSTLARFSVAGVAVPV